ncbi:TonB-dependent siderophore receptor [Horticoccus sp. 23ND18S-11]|uniref:TonB-dependent siderophore receptor n=1 Tax=Horticoccus sp. 23ND18S-11 TaxID=3391832 RepID=UPI0039C92149
MPPKNVPLPPPFRPRRLPVLASVALLSVCSFPAPSGAQTARAPAEEVVTLERFVAAAKADDLYDVLPARDSASLFGVSRPLIDTPRSITVIESSLTDLFSIRTVNDFVAVTAGSFTGNYFGVPGALDVRGERADNFFRGFRRIENRGNFPTPIASTDYTEIVKGPPPPIYGGGKVGGVLNFIPKTAKSKTAKFIDKPVGVSSLTLGTYGKKTGSIEYGAPFSLFGKKSGAYVFVQAEDSDSYYDNIYNKSTLVQVAIDTQLSNSVLLEYGVMAQWADLNQSLGWNRVTQRMIDTDGEYLAGRAALNLDANGNGFLSPSELNAYALEQFAFANPFPYDALTAQQKAAFALNPATVRTVKLSHHTVQVEPIDFSKTDSLTAYFDVTKTSGDSLTLKNQSFYDYMNHTKYSSYGFTADYLAMAFENKTTATIQAKPSANTVLDGVFGVSWRYSSGDERESRGRGYQVLDRRDISVGASGNDRFEGAHTGSANVPYNWRQIGAFTDLGAFALVDTTIAGKLGFIGSARWDRYNAHTNGTDLNAAYGYESASDNALTYNASITYKLDGLSPYVTYATSRYLELGQGGMIDRLNLGGDTWLQDSKIAEAGLKGTVLKGKLFTTLAYYKQEKTAFNPTAGTFDKYKSKGLEFEARYAPTKTLSFTAAATWQRTDLQNPPFFLGVPPSALGLNPAQTYAGRFVAVGGLIGVKSPLEAPTPQRVFSVNGTYTSRQGWGVSLGGTYVSSFYSGYLQQIRLPEYFVTRGALFYNRGPWSFRLNANNILDERYYTPQFLFWDVFISPSIGPTVDLSVSYKW